VTRSIRLAVCLAAFLSPACVVAQAPDAQTVETAPETTSSPVAHVYLGSGTHVLAFSTAANGKLTPVPGSPFNYNVTLMGANGHYLFGFEPSSVTIESFSMAANGSLHEAATTNTQNDAPSTCSPLTYWNGQGLRIDHSGQDLYNAAIPEDLYCYSQFQSFKINNANGKLTFLGDTDKIFFGGPQLNFLGNNQYAYSPNCAAAFGNGPSPNVVVFQRLSSGELVTAKAGVSIPAAPIDFSNPGGPNSGYYCPITMATDPTNHAAMTLYAYDGEDNGEYGPVVIATFTADAKGNLDTTSTYKNMATLPMGPDESCLACSTLRMSPSGKLLAAGGIGGVSIFHFNGGRPATKYKTLLTGDGVGQILWDNNNHMYALGSDTKGAGKLWVYTVTPTSVTEAPGSPYSITNAEGMVVQPL
jgi:hypothetical protein